MRFHFWHTVLICFYAALATFAYLWLSANGKLASFVPVGDFILMTLAIQRLTRLLTYDAITAFIRDWFADASPDSFFGALGTLVNCPWCTGLWFALVVVFFYFATPVIAWYAILVLALSSLATLLQLFANLLGWSAQARKQQCETGGF
jgi:hypothetical protein